MSEANENLTELDRTVMCALLGWTTPHVTMLPRYHSDSAFIEPMWRWLIQNSSGKNYYEPGPNLAGQWSVCENKNGSGRLIRIISHAPTLPLALARAIEAVVKAKEARKLTEGQTHETPRQRDARADSCRRGRGRLDLGRPPSGGRRPAPRRPGPALRRRRGPSVGPAPLPPSGPRRRRLGRDDGGP